MIEEPIMQFLQVVSQLKKYSHTVTLRESVITFTSTIVNGFLGIVYYFYLAKILNPDSFGKSTIFISAVVLGFSIFNFGLDQSITRYKDDKTVLSNIFSLKLILGLLLTFISLIALHTLDIFCLLGLGIASQMLFSLAIAFLQSWQNYLGWSLLYISTNFIRLVIALWSKSPDPLFHVLNYIFVPLIGFIVFAILSQSKLPKLKFSFNQIKKIISFNVPLSLNSILSATTSKIDGFFIASFQSFAQAGVYNLAVQIAIFPHLVTAFSAVTAPKFRDMESKQENQKYLRKTTIFTSIVGLLLFPVLLLTATILFSFSGIDVTSNLNILLLLFIGYAVFFTSVPIRDSLLYYFGDSKIFLSLSIINFILSILSGFLLIRPYGPVAAAGSFLTIQIISVIVLIIRYGQNSRSHNCQK